MVRSTGNFSSIIRSLVNSVVTCTHEYIVMTCQVEIKLLQLYVCAYSLITNRLLGRILKVGVQNFKQGVQGSNVHVLFNPASPRRSPFLSRETPRRSPISRSRC